MMFRKRRYALEDSDEKLESEDGGDEEKDKSEEEQNKEDKKEGEGEHDLLIERAVNKTDAEQAKPMSLTTSILAQREQAAKELAEAEEAAKKAAEQNSGDGFESSSSDDSDSDDKDDDKDDDNDGDSDGDDEGDDDDFDLDDMDFDDPAEEDSEEDDDDDGDDSEAATEDSTPVVKTRLHRQWDLFRTVDKIMKKRILALESMGQEITEEMTNPDPESTVAYTKEGIVEALSLAGELCRKYVERGNTAVDKYGKALTLMDQRVANFFRGIKLGDFTFNNQLYNDVEILKRVSFEETSDPRETLKRMRRYVKDSNDMAALMVKSPFEQLKDVLLTKDFVIKGELLEYVSMVPGFHIVKANVPEYTNYLKTKLTDYQYYNVTETNPNSIYNLKGIAITEEKEATFISEGMKGLISDAVISTDLLKVVIGGFSEFMDTLKVLRVEVEDDAFDKLGEIDMDSKIQQFIIFKMSIEILTLNIELIINYISAMASIIDYCVSFKDEAE